MLQRVGLHKGIAKLVDHYETDEAFYLVMEFVAGGGTRPSDADDLSVGHITDGTQRGRLGVTKSKRYQ